MIANRAGFSVHGLRAVFFATRCRRGSLSAGLGDSELLVAEVGDELERAAEPGDEAVEDVLAGHLAYLRRERRQLRCVTGDA
jgi:hypothetical protein